MQVDVAIVGGGLVGATVGLLLARRSRIEPSRIVLLEPSPAPAPQPGSPIGLRVSAISPGNRAMLAGLGVWQQLDASRIGNYERMFVWHESVPPDSPDVLRFDAAEAGEADLGSIVENNALQSALLGCCRAQGVRIVAASLQAIDIAPAAATLLAGDSRIAAELVVGADGAASAVRSLLGMAADTRDYGQRAIVATVRGERSHGQAAWQRFLSTGPLALLPLPGDECSIVWSALGERADALQRLAPRDFEAELTAASAAVLGTLHLTSQRAAFPLKRLAAQEYAASRVALVGDAAHVIHPLAGQGVNQGLEDAVALAGALASRPARESPGALAPLLRYQRERRAGNALVAATVDTLDLLFTGQESLRTWVAREGMAMVGRSAMARRFLVRQAAGRSLPRR